MLFRSYKVEVININGCKNISDSVNIVFTFISKGEKSSSIKLYPNPITKGLHINIEGAKEGQKFQIVNINGVMMNKIMTELETENLEINLSSGMYFVKIMSQNSEKVTYQKLIVE